MVSIVLQNGKAISLSQQESVWNWVRRTGFYRPFIASVATTIFHIAVHESWRRIFLFTFASLGISWIYHRVEQISNREVDPEKNSRPKDGRVKLILNYVNGQHFEKNCLERTRKQKKTLLGCMSLEAQNKYLDSLGLLGQQSKQGDLREESLLDCLSVEELQKYLSVEELQKYLSKENTLNKDLDDEEVWFKRKLFANLVILLFDSSANNQKAQKWVSEVLTLLELDEVGKLLEEARNSLPQGGIAPSAQSSVALAASSKPSLVKPWATKSQMRTLLKICRLISQAFLFFRYVYQPHFQFYPNLVKFYGAAVCLFEMTHWGNFRVEEKESYPGFFL